MRVALLWRVPLAAASFVAYRVFRWLMRRAMRVFYALSKGQARRWRPLCAASLRNPLALPVLMTSAPRWNPHAVIATSGPLVVQRSLTVDVAEARHAAVAWSIVVYTFPGFRTVTTLEENGDDASLRTVPLPPGRYWLGLRYYHWSADGRLPAVLLDDVDGVPATPLPPAVNDFYHGLARRRGWFYFLLHYYVWVLLRHARRWPRFVEREYLPVGNPGTRFLYGPLGRGDRLLLYADSEVLRTHFVFVTVYNRSSLPVARGEVTANEYVTAPCDRPGSYLIRIHPRAPNAEDPHADSVRVRVEASGPPAQNLSSPPKNEP